MKKNILKFCISALMAASQKQNIDFLFIVLEVLHRMNGKPARYLHITFLGWVPQPSYRGDCWCHQSWHDTQIMFTHHTGFAVNHSIMPLAIIINCLIKVSCTGKLTDSGNCTLTLMFCFKDQPANDEYQCKLHSVRLRYRTDNLPNVR